MEAKAAGDEGPRWNGTHAIAAASSLPCLASMLTEADADVRRRGVGEQPSSSKGKGERWCGRSLK